MATFRSHTSYRLQQLFFPVMFLSFLSFYYTILYSINILESILMKKFSPDQNNQDPSTKLNILEFLKNIRQIGNNTKNFIQVLVAVMSLPFPSTPTIQVNYIDFLCSWLFQLWKTFYPGQSPQYNLSCEVSLPSSYARL